MKYQFVRLIAVKRSLFFPPGYGDISTVSHEMMSFCRKCVKTFTRQKLWKIGTRKEQHKFSTKSSCCPSVLGHLSLMLLKGWECQDGCHLDNISIYNGIHPLMDYYGKPTYHLYVLSAELGTWGESRSLFGSTFS